MYKEIISNFNPTNIEIGSIVSSKVLPIFSDTTTLLSLINKEKENKNNKFILIPNKEKLRDVIKYRHINFFSFITSTSNGFQLKNTKKSLKESDDELIEMLYDLENKFDKTIVKLYVSCINECPIEGKIDNDFIVNRLLNLHNLNVDIICLSDTCGSLDPEDFEYIIDTCKFFGIPMSKLSLHLHVHPDRINIIEQIIWKALDRKIVNFDVSNLKRGGCSVTMNQSQLCPNLSYELYYQSICKYIIKNANKQ
jgi:hydroxymethylglutaryl-CoA lyase